MSTLVGTVERWQDLGNGTFFCPGCGSERAYKHRRSRNWLQLVIPLVPREVTGDIYECQTCHREYDEHVITSPPTSDLATRLQRVTRAATVLAVLDGDPYDEPTRRVAVTVIQGAGMPHYTATDLDADLRSMNVEHVDTEAQQLTIDMDPAARERLVLDIGHVTTATGEFSASNRAMIDRLGRAMELTPGAVHRVLGRLDQEANHIGAFAEHGPDADPAGDAAPGEAAADSTEPEDR